MTILLTSFRLLVLRSSRAGISGAMRNTCVNALCTCGVSVRCVLTFQIRLPLSRRGQVALGVNKEEDRIRNRGH